MFIFSRCVSLLSLQRNSARTNSNSSKGFPFVLLFFVHMCVYVYALCILKALSLTFIPYINSYAASRTKSTEKNTKLLLLLFCSCPFFVNNICFFSTLFFSTLFLFFVVCSEGFFVTQFFPARTCSSLPFSATAKLFSFCCCCCFSVALINHHFLCAQFIYLLGSLGLALFYTIVCIM